MKFLGLPIKKIINLYGDNISSREIAKNFNCSQNTILRILKNNNIPRKSNSEGKLKGKYKPTKKELEKLYWGDNLSTVEIGKKFGFNNGTIRRWMIKHGISRKPLSESKFKVKLSKEELKKLYIDQKLSTNKIAKMLNTDIEYVRRKLIFYGIERRDNIETVTVKVDLKLCKNMAYILGVMKGDGGLVNNNVSLCVTDKGFAENFLNALKEIGFNANMSNRVKKEEPQHKEKWHVWGSSKNFAIWYKNLTIEHIENIISKNAEYVKEFIRGFYESEGHHSKKEHIDISNSNLNLLLLVQKLLINFGIMSNIYGPYYNKKNPKWKPMYNLGINKFDAFHFFCTISPIIKFKHNVWCNTYLNIIRKISKKFKNILGFKNDIKINLISSEEMKSLLNYSPIKDTIKSEIPFVSSNEPFTIYTCVETLKEITKNLNKSERNLFMGGAIIHELYHGLINNSFGNSFKEKQKEEEYIIKEMREKFPEQRRILDTLII
jgi:intein-encoded DNA endonuclease-like protein